MAPTSAPRLTDELPPIAEPPFPRNKLPCIHGRSEPRQEPSQVSLSRAIPLVLGLDVFRLRDNPTLWTGLADLINTR